MVEKNAYMVLFDILSYSISSLIWGILISLACMALFVFLIKGWYKDATFSPASYLVGFVLFVLLCFQCILIVGSLKIINTSDEYEAQISAIVESIYTPSEEVPQEQASSIIDEIIKESPILQYYIGGGEFSGYKANELPHAIVEELQSFMRWFIFRRILWCLGFVVVGAIIVIKSMKKSYLQQRIRTLTSSKGVQGIRLERKPVSRRPRR